MQAAMTECMTAIRDSSRRWARNGGGGSHRRTGSEATTPPRFDFSLDEGFIAGGSFSFTLGGNFPRWLIELDVEVNCPHYARPDRRAGAAHDLRTGHTGAMEAA